MGIVGISVIYSISFAVVTYSFPSVLSMFLAFPKNTTMSLVNYLTSAIEGAIAALIIGCLKRRFPLKSPGGEKLLSELFSFNIFTGIPTFVTTATLDLLVGALVEHLSHLLSSQEHHLVRKSPEGISSSESIGPLVQNLQVDRKKEELETSSPPAARHHSVDLGTSKKSRNLVPAGVIIDVLVGTVVGWFAGGMGPATLLFGNDPTHVPGIVVTLLASGGATGTGAGSFGWVPAGSGAGSFSWVVALVLFLGLVLVIRGMVIGAITGLTFGLVVGGIHNATREGLFSSIAYLLEEKDLKKRKGKTLWEAMREGAIEGAIVGGMVGLLQGIATAVAFHNKFHH
ncbi:hypothetical protein EPA93_11340 [Ktedonosporobacter rubrisoli]|uniref:Uncharacterized protein n=1 Tax=Ktedonosporobacter rubrisoli TaxID=2509675 RepID=A0A4P6JNC3_KTERU|nr:hypothetical protein [Ktedonosporobacter rubrisoli]QBD76562.1 hypothetical protein EPA93_11340 [Ktedonosporobacter rubrisoli]